ncbi:hypothetical protein CP533_0454 [Ophiocordyceps camponoti-saundersi (nom. inval.)]|nr:hypothetical protein CP533_0454 [Ophiocordyceps camponoti-saundersi (nom. inval.)]
MWNSTGINFVNRLNLGILLNDVSAASCPAMLETNGFLRGVTVTGTLGGLVCNGATVPPAWVFDGDDGGKMATFSRLRVAENAGYVVRYGQRGVNESYWEYIDEVQPGSRYKQTPESDGDCGDEGVCIGSLTVNGTEYGVSFTGNLGVMLCNNFTLDPAPVDGGPTNNGDRAESQEVARRSWHTLPPYMANESSVKILPNPQSEALPVLEARGDGFTLAWIVEKDFNERLEPMKEICLILTAINHQDLTITGTRIPGAVIGGTHGATGAAALLGIENGRVLVGGPAAKILLAGGAKEVSGAIFAGAGAVGTVGAVVAPVVSDLALKTACGIITGKTQVRYNPNSEAGRGIEAWGRLISGQGLSTKEWVDLWQGFPTKFPIIRQLIGLGTGETRVGINHNHPLLRAIKYFVSALVPLKVTDLY